MKALAHSQKWRLFILAVRAKKASITVACRLNYIKISIFFFRSQSTYKLVIVYFMFQSTVHLVIVHFMFQSTVHLLSECLYNGSLIDQ